MADSDYVEESYCVECGVEFFHRPNEEPRRCNECSDDTAQNYSHDRADASEAIDLMAAWYQEHQLRLIAHICIVVISGGVWLLWFVFFTIGTMMGWKNMEALRENRNA